MDNTERLRVMMPDRVTWGEALTFSTPKHCAIMYSQFQTFGTIVTKAW